MPAQPQKAIEWVYAATVEVPASHAVEVRVSAYDLAGNRVDQAAAPQ